MILFRKDVDDTKPMTLENARGQKGPFMYVSYWNNFLMRFVYPDLVIFCVFCFLVIVRELSYLPLWVSLDLPASGQLQLCVCKLVDENHQIPVMLVALKVPGVPTHLQDHVLHTAAAGEHAVRCLRRIRPFNNICERR